MSNVICSCLLGDNAKVRLRLSQLLHDGAEAIYGEGEGQGEEPDSICEVELPCCRREFFTNNTGASFRVGQQVIVESDGGYDFGVVYATGPIARKKFGLKGLNRNGYQCLAVLRVADEADQEVIAGLQSRKEEIREICASRIERHMLDLKLVDVELRMDQQKLSVYYTSSHRVDFRALVRDLAGEFKARIQMVQITTREEARRGSSFGPCGYTLCCSSWIQKIHANPFSDKAQMMEAGGNENHSFNITGICNRPKCCLAYSKPEKGCRHQCATAGASSEPVKGQRLSTSDGPILVEHVDVQKKCVVLRHEKTRQTRRMSFDKFNAQYNKK